MVLKIGTNNNVPIHIKSITIEFCVLIGKSRTFYCEFSSTPLRFKEPFNLKVK